MFCSRSIGVHLLKGLGAGLLVTLAIYLGAEHLLLSAASVVGAVLLLRGCPMCWLFGLLETIGNKRKAPGNV